MAMSTTTNPLSQKWNRISGHDHQQPYPFPEEEDMCMNMSTSPSLL